MICGSGRFVRTVSSGYDPWLKRITTGFRRSRWVICKGCGLVFQNPRPASEEVEKLYAEHEYRKFSEEALASALIYSLERPAEMIDYLGQFIDFNPQNGAKRKVLDIGAGTGGALVRFIMRGCEVYGVEPDERLADLGNNVFKINLKKEFFTANTFPGLKVDLVFTCHAYEHFIDPIAISCDAKELLANDGMLFVSVPTFRRSQPFGWAGLSSPDICMFTHISLKNILHRAGFRVVQHKYVGREGELWVVAVKNADGKETRLPAVEDWRWVQAELLVAVPLRGLFWSIPRVAGRWLGYLQLLCSDPKKLFSRLRNRVRRYLGALERVGVSIVR